MPAVHTCEDNRATGGTGVADLSRRIVVIVVLICSCTAGVLAQEPARAAEFGIRANVSDDQTAAVQKYLNDVEKRGGGEARLGPGQYTIRGSLRVPTAVMLTGAWEMPHHGIITKGTVLMAYAGRGKEDGPAFIELSPSSGVRGVTICYPEQKLTDVQPYPWAIHGHGMHNTVENVTLVNAWQGIAIGPEWNELHVIRNVFGCVLRRGVYIDNTSDIGRIENVHFNPHYWPRSGHDGVPRDAKPNPDLAVGAYMQENLEAFIFGRTDWQSVRDTFVFGAKVGYRFIKTPRGSCNGQFSGIGADVCQYCVVVDAAQGPGILISNGQFVCISLGPKAKEERIGIVTGKSFDATIQLSNCSFWGDFTHFARIEGSGRFSLSQARLENSRKTGIEILGGRATIRDSAFATKSGHVLVGESVKRVTVTDNAAEGGLKIENRAGDRLVARDNE